MSIRVVKYFLKAMRDYIRFLKFVKPHIWIMAIAVVCMIASSGMGGVSLGMIIPLVDNILAGKTVSIPGVQEPPQFLTSLVDKINTIPKVSLALSSCGKLRISRA